MTEIMQLFADCDAANSSIHKTSLGFFNTYIRAKAPVSVRPCVPNLLKRI